MTFDTDLFVGSDKHQSNICCAGRICRFLELFRVTVAHDSAALRIGHFNRAVAAGAIGTAGVNSKY